MKKLIVGTFLGRFALIARDKFELLRCLLYHPNELHTLLNDKLASYLMTRIYQQNITFVDIGSHIGSVIAEVHHNNPSAKIIAFEAMPDKANNLKNKFPYAQVFSCALGEDTKDIIFHVNKRKSGYSSLIKPDIAGVDDYRQISVKMKRLDDIPKINDVDFIKIDVEGAELGVLYGSLRLINRCRPLIMFESGPEIKENGNVMYTKSKLFDFFESVDYCLVIPNRLAHNDPGLQKDCFIESHLFPRRTTNYFAVPKERRGKIRDRARQILLIDQ